MDKYVTVKELHEILKKKSIHLNIQTLYRKVKDGTIPSFKFGRNKIFIPIDAIDSLLEGGNNRG